MQSTAPTDFDEQTPLNLNEERFAFDNRLFVEFYRKPRLQRKASVDAGRAIYRETDYIRIVVPGDKSSAVDRPVNSIDSRRFADRLAKWRAGQSEAVSGTPLVALPGMTPAKVKEYEYFKIMTVEQLAAAPDNLGQKFMSFQQDKQRANAFLQVAANNAPIEKMNEELQKRDAEIDELRSMVEALQAQSGGRRKVAAEAVTPD
jgi:hypothetical protein